MRRIAEELRVQGKKIVTTNGSFDLVHDGHAYMLEKARAQGDVLIVGLNSDASIKKYKNPKRPIITQEHRAHMLACLQAVDYVTIFDDTVPLDFIESIHPHVHVNSAEYGENCVERPLLDKLGAKLMLVEKIGDLSTSHVIKKILELEDDNKK
jgi:rfaE bifunctional protein nucleotidyltransferase chain/domain